MPESTLLLGIDTCGLTGSVALGRWDGQTVEILGQIEFEGRSYSSTLVAAVGELLTRGGVTLRGVGAIVSVSGPGSFTGVRVGLSAVKGLAEGTRIPVAAVSRLEVLAAKAGTLSAALDAHRHEVFLRLGMRVEQGRELLAGSHELDNDRPAAPHGSPSATRRPSCCWLRLGHRQNWCAPPRPLPPMHFILCALRVAAGEFVDLALLDGHYLRRSDAEIFGEPAAAEPQRP